MNYRLAKAGREIIKELLQECIEKEQLMFKYMYGKGDSTSDINIIVDKMDEDNIDWGITQCEQYIDNRAEKVKKMVSTIIDKLGSNHTETISFTSVNENNKVYALYTYRGDVFVLKEGMDIPFEDIDYDEKKDVINYIESGTYVVDNTIQ